VRVDPPDFPERGRTLLSVVLLVGLLARVAWGWVQPVDEAFIERLPDQREYLSLGRSLAKGNGLSFVDPRFGQVVHAFRTPGYPLFIAALGGNVRAVRVAQALVDTSTALAIYLLARRWLSRGAGTFAAAIVALNPFLIYFSGLALSETLFTALLAWGMCLLIRGTSTAQPPGPPASAGGEAAGKRAPWSAILIWLAGGLLLALSVLVRQSALPVPVLLGLVAAFVNRTQAAPYHRRWPLPAGATMALLTGLTLLPWAYRNSQVMGTWVWTTTNGGITAYDGFNPDATGASDQSFVQMMPELRHMGEVGRDEHLKQLAREYAREHPRRVAELAAVKAGRTWSPIPLSADYSGLKYKLVGLLYSLPFDLLVIAGLFSNVRDGGLPKAAKVFLLSPAIYFTAVHALSVGSLRYRIPVEPPMAILAAAGAAMLVARVWPGGLGRWKRASSVKPEVRNQNPQADSASASPPPSEF
jgi:4-amino-4-deoxy-L-arabinose transferase-like glycosyltransferase